MAQIQQHEIALLAFEIINFNLSYGKTDGNGNKSYSELEQIFRDQRCFMELYRSIVCKAFEIKATEGLIGNSSYISKIDKNADQLVVDCSGWQAKVDIENRIRQHFQSCYPGIELCSKISAQSAINKNQNYSNNPRVIMGVMLSLAGLGLAIAAIAIVTAATMTAAATISAIGLLGIFGGAACIANGLGVLDSALMPHSIG